MLGNSWSDGGHSPRGLANPEQHLEQTFIYIHLLLILTTFICSSVFGFRAPQTHKFTSSRASSGTSETGSNSDGLQPTSDGLAPNRVLASSSFLLLVVTPGATSSFLLLVAMPLLLVMMP